MFTGGFERVRATFAKVLDKSGDSPLTAAASGRTWCRPGCRARFRASAWPRRSPNSPATVEGGHIEAKKEHPGLERNVCAVDELGWLTHGLAHLAVDGTSVWALVGAVG